MSDGSQVANQAVQGILSRIDSLAQKLGTTAANVWSIYVAQAKVEAVRDAFIAALDVLAVLFGLFFLKRIEDEGFEVVTFLLLLGGLGVFLLFGYNATGEWLNPQYWAFTHLTADLRNLF